LQTVREGYHVILRLLRVRVNRGAAVELVRRLREEAVPEAMGQPGMVALNYGFRQQAGDTHGLAISVWDTYDELLAAAGGDTQRIATSVPFHDLVNDVRIAHYELAESAPPPGAVLDGAVIGIITSTLRPHVEPAAFDMIRDSAAGIHEAGAVARYVGRRVAGARSEVAAVVIWPDRSALRLYARSRPDGFMRPAYVDLLESWSFETYDALSPDRLLISSSGPAVLLADDDARYVDASPGVERVFGLPGEFMLGRQVFDFTPLASVEAARRAWQDFLRAGEMEGAYELQKPNGGMVSIRYRARAHCPEAGLHASVFELADDPLDDRPVEAIVQEAFAS
jgi:PAS domain-containing protein